MVASMQVKMAHQELQAIAQQLQATCTTAVTIGTKVLNLRSPRQMGLWVWVTIQAHCLSSPNRSGADHCVESVSTLCLAWPTGWTR